VAQSNQKETKTKPLQLNYDVAYTQMVYDITNITVQKADW